MTVNAAVEPVQPMHTMSSIASAFARLQAELLNKHVTVRVGPVTAEYMAERGSQEILVWLERNSKYTGTVHFKVAYENQLMALYNDTFPWHGSALPSEGTPDQLLKIMTKWVLEHVRKSATIRAATEPAPALDGSGGRVWRRTVKVMKQLKRIGEFEVAGHADDNCSVTLRNQHGQLEFDVSSNVCLSPCRHTGRNLLDVVAYIPEGPVPVLEAPLPDSVPVIIKAVVAYAHKHLGKSTHAAVEPSQGTAALFEKLYKNLQHKPISGKYKNISYTLTCAGNDNSPVHSIVLNWWSRKEHRDHLGSVTFNNQNGTVTRGFMADFMLPSSYNSTRDLILGMLRVACGDWKRGVPARAQAAAEPPRPASSADTSKLVHTFAMLREFLRPKGYRGYKTELVDSNKDTWSVWLWAGRRGSIEIEARRDKDDRPLGGVGLEAVGDMLVFNGSVGSAEVQVRRRRACLNPRDLLRGILDVLPHVLYRLYNVGSFPGPQRKIVIGAVEPEPDVVSRWWDFIHYTSTPKHFRSGTQPAVAESKHGAVLVGVGGLKFMWFRLNSAGVLQFGEYGKHELSAAVTGTLLRDQGRLLQWMARSVDIGKPAPLNGGA